MPALIIGAAVLAALLLSRKSEAATREEQARLDAERKAAEQKAAADAQAKGISTAVGVGTTALGGAVSLVSSLLGGGGVAAGGTTAASTATAGTVAASTATATTSTATATATTAGTVAGGVAAGTVAAAASVVVVVAAIAAAVGFAVSKALESPLDAGAALQSGPLLRQLYENSLRRHFEKNAEGLLAKIPAAAWPAAQGPVRNAALLMSIATHRAMNNLYRSGMLAHPKQPGASDEAHEAYWRQFNVFFGEDEFEDFVGQWVISMGAGPMSQVTAAAVAAVGNSTLLERVLLKSRTSGKILFYFGAITGKGCLGYMGSGGQPRWFNKWAVEEIVLMGWPAFVATTSVSGTFFAAGLGLMKYSPIYEQTFQFDGNFGWANGLYIENGLVFDVTQSLATGRPAISSTEDVNAILAGTGIRV